MKKYLPVALGVLCVFALLALGLQIRSAFASGEVPNPNVGKPSKSGAGRGLSRQAADSMDKDGYKAFLKRNRPDLSEAELEAKAENWWRIKSGG